MEQKFNSSSEINVNGIMRDKQKKPPSKPGQVMIDSPDSPSDMDSKKETIDIVCSPLNMSKKL